MSGGLRRLGKVRLDVIGFCMLVLGLIGFLALGSVIVTVQPSSAPLAIAIFGYADVVCFYGGFAVLILLAVRHIIREW